MKMHARYSCNAPTLAIRLESYTSGSILGPRRHEVDVYNRGGWWESIHDIKKLDRPELSLEPMEKEAAIAWLKQPVEKQR